MGCSKGQIQGPGLANKRAESAMPVEGHRLHIFCIDQHREDRGIGRKRRSESPLLAGRELIPPG